MKKIKNSTTKILCKICVTLKIYVCMTLKIYVEPNISNLNVKFKPQKTQCLAQIRRWNCTKTVPQLIMIKFSKSLPLHSKLTQVVNKNLTQNHIKIIP